MRPARPAIALALALLVTLACSSALPGTVLGTYKVTATPRTNTCGSGLGVPDPWVFEVEISEQGTKLYWSWLDGSALLSGTVDADASTTTTLTSNTSGNVDPGADGAAGPCTMQRSDTIATSLGSGSPPGTFSGTIQYDFGIVSGSTCADQLSSAGGSYAALPCTVVFSMSASRQ
jgi:hypothetical protein